MINMANKLIQLKDNLGNLLFPKNYQKVLYNDNIGTLDEITLFDNSEYYEYIEIFFYGASDYTRASIKIYKPDGKNAMLVTGYPNGQSTNIKMATVEINKNKVTKKWYCEGTGGTDWGNRNSIYIDRIIGYK